VNPFAKLLAEGYEIKAVSVMPIGKVMEEHVWLQKGKHAQLVVFRRDAATGEAAGVPLFQPLTQEEPR
jgi:hypothetical protein